MTTDLYLHGSESHNIIFFNLVFKKPIADSIEEQDVQKKSIIETANKIADFLKEQGITCFQSRKTADEDFYVTKSMTDKENHFEIHFFIKVSTCSKKYFDLITTMINATSICNPAKVTFESTAEERKKNEEFARFRRMK
jgi:hypothetical protein